MNWNGFISTILLVTDDNCHLAARTIASFCAQEWEQRELIVVNSSGFTFGSNGFREIRMAAKTPQVAMHSAAIGLAGGDICVIWKAGCLYTSRCLLTVESVLRRCDYLELRQEGMLSGEAFWKASQGEREKVKTLQIITGTEPTPTCIRPHTDGLGNPDDLNILCPAGIGDVLWVLSKFSKVPNAVFWLPGCEQRRSGGLLQAAGVRYGYLDTLSTNWVWNQPDIPVPKKGWVAVQANRHLEAGRALADWHPEFACRYPALKLGYQPNQTNYVVAFMCGESYMGGQLLPQRWGEILHCVERTLGPVLLVGAGRDVDFAKEVEKHYKPKMAPMYDCPVEEVLAVVLRAKAMVSVASGLAIAAIVYGVPTLISYPSHLAKMPGTWEPAQNWQWCLQRDLFNVVSSGILEKL